MENYQITLSIEKLKRLLIILNNAYVINNNIDAGILKADIERQIKKRCEK